MSLVNSHCGFTQLQEVWLGDVYPHHFYDHLPAPVRDAFYTITDWTKHDLSKIEKKLQELGVVVRRPVYESIDHCVNTNGNLVKPAIAARDDTLVLGNTLYYLRNQFTKNPWQKALDEYRVSGAEIEEHIGDAWACISPPCMVRLGQDIYVDWIYHKHVWGMVTEPLVELAKNYRVHVSMIDGHSDCIFCPVREGLILTTDYKKSYGKTFPGWDVYNIKSEKSKKPINMGGGFHQWQVPDTKIGANKEFQQHVQTKAQDWVGSYIETVFDVNLLVVDDRNILSVGEDEETFTFLHKQGFNVHAFNFRCRNFWDGGMHCLTNDIRRKGTCENYFPERSGFGLDWLIDEN